MPVNDILSLDLPKKATRDGYGDALVAMGEQYSKLVVLDADLSGSTKTKPFAKKYLIVFLILVLLSKTL